MAVFLPLLLVSSLCMRDSLLPWGGVVLLNDRDPMPSNVMNFLTSFLLTPQFPPTLKLLKEPAAFSLASRIACPLNLAHSLLTL